MGHVEVVGLRARGAGVVAQLFLRLLFGLDDQIEVVGDADDLHRMGQVCVGELGHDLGLELHRPSLTLDMGRGRITDQPVFFRIDPDVEAPIEQQRHGLSGGRGIEQMAFDHRQVGVDEDSAVEAGDWLGQGQGLDQHAHAAGRAAAGDGQGYAGLNQRRRRGHRGRRQHLVLGDQGAVHVGQQKADIARPVHTHRSIPVA
jgi:hypothetical protein